MGYSYTQHAAAEATSAHETGVHCRYGGMDRQKDDSKDTGHDKGMQACVLKAFAGLLDQPFRFTWRVEGRGRLEHDPKALPAPSNTSTLLGNFLYSPR